MDLLQSAEVVAAVLCRTDGGEQYERLLGFAGTTGVGGREGKVTDMDTEGESPIHGNWDRSDGLLLPPTEALKKAGLNAITELRTRRSLAKTGRVPSAPSSAPSPAPSSSGSGVGGTDALVGLLMDHSAPKLAARVVLVRHGEGWNTHIPCRMIVTRA